MHGVDRLENNKSLLNNTLATANISKLSTMIFFHYQHFFSNPNSVDGEVDAFHQHSFVEIVRRRMKEAEKART